MPNFLRALLLSVLFLGSSWLGSLPAVHADVMPPPVDAGPGDGSVDAGPPVERTGLPPLGCTVAGLSVGVGPSIALVLALGLARSRRR